MPPVTGLSSSSTLAEIKAAYDDNASYDVDNSLTECGIFIAACRILLRRLPASARQGEEMAIDLDLRLVRDELARAVRWRSQKNAVGGGVRFTDFSLFRR